MTLNNTTQIALFAQRRIKNKLHAPNAQGKPQCGRQLNNHRAERAQAQGRLEFAGSLEEFTYQLMSGKACTHCARKIGLLQAINYRQEGEESDE